MAFSKIIAESMDLTDAYNFTGTLQQNGAGIGGANTPAFSVYLGSSQTISDATDTKINFDTEKIYYVKSDIEQLNRVFINLFKNSIESLKEKQEKMGDFRKKIDVEIKLINDYINIVVQDNGSGFTNNDTRILSKPYFTTKKEGSGLGLSIVEKILNDHNGFIEFISQKEGAKIKILLPKYVN